MVETLFLRTKTPEVRDRYTMLVIDGANDARHYFKTKVGMGSSGEDSVGQDTMIEVFSFESTGMKRCNGESIARRISGIQPVATKFSEPEKVLVKVFAEPIDKLSKELMGW